MSEREPCQQFVRQWPVGNGEWIDTTGKVCPRCGFMESEHRIPQEGWQPIATAPKEIVVLVHDEGWVGKAMRQDGRWLDVECSCPDAFIDPPPQHWQPLPAPPKEQEHPHAGEPSGESAPTFDAPKPVLRPNPWRVLEDALDAGIAYGVNRADKHADDVLTDAQRQRVTTAVYEAVMLEMSERFMWDDEV